MTRIDFYTHVADKMPVLVQLVKKAWGQNMQIWIRTASTALAQDLDRRLWTHHEAGFIPHCCSDSPLCPDTPVIIDGLDQEPMTHQLLINLHPTRSAFFTRFERLVEIVGLDETDRQQARERYIHYRDRGFEIHSHNLASKK